MDFLTSTILAGVAWDVIKEGGKLTANYLKTNLKKWALKDSEYDIIAETINEASAEDIKSIKYLDAYIDSDETIQKILKTTKSITSYIQDNNTYTGSVNASGNSGHQTITINNGVTEQKK